MPKNTNFNNKTILITGGAGFIGSNLALFFQKNFPKSKVVVFDCFRNNEKFNNGNLKSFGHYKNLIGFYGDIICGNINISKDLALLHNYDFDYIFHHAAISDTRIYDQNLVMQTNVNSFYEILDLAKKNNSTLVYASSAAVYGNSIAPQIEGKESPDNPYGYSKLVMDNLAKSFSIKNPEMKIIGLRFFNVYGSHEFYKAKTSSMVIQLGHQILNSQTPRLFENSDKIFRDFIYIDDVIDANLKACSSESNGSFNIGTGIARSFQDIVDILKTQLNVDVETVYFPNPFSGYQTNTQANITSSMMNFGFDPKFTLEEGIKAYLPEIKALHGEESL